MKTRTWIALLLGLLALCALLSLPLLTPGSEAISVEIYSGGQKIRTLSLLEDQQITVSAPDGGFNVISVSQGRIAVIDASCPDGHCMKRGYTRHGPSIICLPNALEIRFCKEAPVDLPLG